MRVDSLSPSPLGFLMLLRSSKSFSFSVAIRDVRHHIHRIKRRITKALILSRREVIVVGKVGSSGETVIKVMSTFRHVLWLHGVVVGQGREENFRWEMGK